MLYLMLYYLLVFVSTHAWFSYMLAWFRFIDTHLFVCARHLALFYVLVGLFSDNHGPTYSDFKLNHGGPLWRLKWRSGSVD